HSFSKRHFREIIEGKISLKDLTGSADRKSTRLNSSHTVISYAVFCVNKERKSLYTEVLSFPSTSYELTTHSVRYWRSSTARYFFFLRLGRHRETSFFPSTAVLHD